ncbi:MAG: GlyGly-CTERM sorting domain-containing protein, partial [Steroidobacteraceae bacterium]|nr:GlyGly-CTERM sorting domain-containing protein [Steroidobacteraceae bacterium]
SSSGGSSSGGGKGGGGSLDWLGLLLLGLLARRRG